MLTPPQQHWRPAVCVDVWHAPHCQGVMPIPTCLCLHPHPCESPSRCVQEQGEAGVVEQTVESDEWAQRLL